MGSGQWVVGSGKGVRSVLGYMPTGVALTIKVGSSKLRVES